MNMTRAFRKAGRFTANLFSLTLLLAALPVSIAVAATTGEQKTAVILVNFQDFSSQPITPANAHSLVFGTVSDYYWEASYQKTFLSGDTYGWVTVPVNEGVCNNNVFAQEADKQLSAAGVNLAQYTRLIYLMPGKACMDGGSNSGSTLPARMFATANEFNSQLVIHELGHTFGLMHSATEECGAAVIGGNCTSYSYGDQADTMGSGFAAHFNAVHKERLGWLGAAGTPPITTVSSNGSYTLSPYESTAPGAKALKIPRGNDPATGQMSYYYIEYRQPLGFDAGLGSLGNLTKGVLVHINQTNSALLDMTPNSDTTYNYMDARDGALDVGRSFTDSSAGITITLQSADANGAVVQVNLGSAPAPTCTRAAPTLSLTGPTTAVAAGSTVSYTLSLSNKDSSACAATTFNLARTVPSGWTGTLAASSLSLSPGATSSTTLSVSSASTAAAGGYGIGGGASSSIGSVHTANASATYSVAAQGSGTLTGTVGTDKTSYVRGETVYMSALVKNNGVALSGASVRFTVTLPNGATVLVNATSGSDGYARATYKLGKGRGAIGNYLLRADASSGSSTAAASTSFSLR